MLALSPKSSFTLSSPAEEEDKLADSEVLFPRNSHREVRAKPCCGREAVAAWSGAVPKTYMWCQFHFEQEHYML